MVLSGKGMGHQGARNGVTSKDSEREVSCATKSMRTRAMGRVSELKERVQRLSKGNKGGGRRCRCREAFFGGGDRAIRRGGGVTGGEDKIMEGEPNQAQKLLCPGKRASKTGRGKNNEKGGSRGMSGRERNRK